MLWGTGIGQFFFSIRKQHTVNKGTRVQGTCSEYFRGFVYSYSFSIYCAANHGILCSVEGVALFWSGISRSSHYYSEFDISWGHFRVSIMYFLLFYQ